MDAYFATLTTVVSGWETAKYKGFDIIWTTSRVFPSRAPALTRRAPCSAWWLCGWNADWCLRSDVVTNTCLQDRRDPRHLHELGRRGHLGHRRRGRSHVHRSQHVQLRHGPGSQHRRISLRRPRADRWVEWRSSLRQLHRSESARLRVLSANGVRAAKLSHPAMRLL